MLVNLESSWPVGLYSTNRHCVAKNVTSVCANFGSNQTAKSRDCRKWKEQKLVTTKSARLLPRESGDRNVSRLSPAQENLDSTWKHYTRGTRVVKTKNAPAPRVPLIKPQEEVSIPQLWR